MSFGADGPKAHWNPSQHACSFRGYLRVNHRVSVFSTYALVAFFVFVSLVCTVVIVYKPGRVFVLWLITAPDISSWLTDGELFCFDLSLPLDVFSFRFSELYFLVLRAKCSSTTVTTTFPTLVIRL